MALYAPIPSWAEDQPQLSSALVMKRDIPWDTYTSARLISDKDLQNIRMYDKAPAKTQEDVLATEGEAVVGSLLAVLRNVTREETVQYVLALLLELLSADKERSALFFGGGRDAAADVFPPLLRLLQRADWYTQEKACQLLTALLDTRPGKRSGGRAPPAAPSSSPSTLPAAAVAPAGIEDAAADGGVGSAAAADGGQKAGGGSTGAEETLAAFLDWLCSQLRRPSSPTKSVPAAVHALATLLKEHTVRVLFTRAGGVPLLAPLLRIAGVASPNPQMVYDAGVCVWNLTFYPQAAHLMHNAGIVAGLVELVKLATKEKVLRVALYALRNLLTTEGGVAIDADIVETGLVKAVAAKNACNFDDEDLAETLEWMAEHLERNIHETSSWERYRRELLAGQLEWSPMHSSEKFWRENVDGFEERDFQALRVLLKLLEGSRDARTLAVACFDLGQFVTFFPHGRQMVMDLRGKELVMRLMMHPSEEVQKQALLCVQKILLSKDKVEYLHAMQR